eukprot:Rmarinus@m.29700
MGEGRGNFACRDFALGDIVDTVGGEVASEPSTYTLQIDEDTHLLCTTEFRFTNHACKPNTYIDLSNRSNIVVRALCPIQSGEALTFDYCTTEWDMAEKFDCQCGATTCRGSVQGFRHLTPQQRDALGPHVAPYLWERLRKAATVN